MNNDAHIISNTIKESSSTRSDWQSMARLWELAGPLKRQVAKGIIFRFIQSFCLGLGYGVAIIVVTNLVSEHFTPTSHWLMYISSLALLSLLGQITFSFLSARQCWFASFELARDLRLTMLDRLKKLPLGFHLSRHRGDTVTMVTTDMQTVESFLSDGLPRIAESLGLPIAVLMFLLCQDISLFLTGVVSIVIALPVYFSASHQLAKLGIVRQDTQANAAARMLEYVQGLVIIKSFNRLAKGQEDFNQAITEFRNLSIHMIKRLIIPFIALGTIAMLGIPLVMYVDSSLYISSHIPLSLFITTLMLLYALYSPLLGLVAVMEQTRMADASLSRMDRVLTELPLPESTVSLFPSSCNIEFNNVSFSYDNRKHVIKNVSFHVAENSMTAIVGPSGAGKSTLLNLLARFWDPNLGTISIGDIDIRDMSTDALNSLVTIVFQDVFLFSGTILDNITIGKSDATEEDIINAAKMAQAHDFIMALPNGYQTNVGEGGSTLSGGERQRLSIARAILKDAPIVIMDEATAAIDPTNERAFHHAFNSLVSRKTVIVVAHKLSTIKRADQILVVSDGTIVETGNHQTLVSEPGLYSELWQRWTQAANWHIKTR